MISVTLVSLLFVAALTNAQCNPLKSTCPAIAGLSKNSYSIDFAQQSGQPSDWILAEATEIQYGANGAEFSFKKRYDAPYIWSSFYILFGRIEVVLQAAPGAGIISGAVMMSDDMDETDWEFSGNNFGSSTEKVQTNYFGKGITGDYDRGTQPYIDSPTARFHTYALDWSPTSLTWSIDGTNVRTLNNNGHTSGPQQFPQTPSRLHLGLWCGGDPDTNPSTVQWAGGYTNFSQAPFTAYVKSVKITTPNPCSSWQYPASFSGKWQDVKCTNLTISSAKSTPISTPTPSNLPCTYTIVAGDYGYLIASKLGVSFDDLKTANSNINWDMLILGKSLQVPGGQCKSTMTPPSSALLTTSTFTATSTAATEGSTSSSSGPSNLLSKPVTYTVAAGDYGYKIADELRCSFELLQAANPGIDWDKLLIGQILNVPGANSVVNSVGFTTSSSATTITLIVATASLSSSQQSSSSTTTPAKAPALVPPVSSLTSDSRPSSSLSSTPKPSSHPLSISSLSFSSTTTLLPSSPKLTCNHDNCLNNLLDLRYLPQLRQFCSSFISATQTLPLPISKMLGGCQGKAERVRSACQCLVTSLTSESPPAAGSTGTLVGTGPWVTGTGAVPTSASAAGAVALGGGGWGRVMRQGARLGRGGHA